VIGQIIQLVGALLILVGFAGSQVGWFDVKDLRYLALNALGSGILAAIAIIGRQWGFILLESVWTIISLIGIFNVITTRRRTT
jgi:hypothetical protein